MSRKIIIDEAKVLQLYKSGKNDREIGELMKCNSQVIYNWRTRNRLPAIRPNKAVAEAQMAIARDALKHKKRIDYAAVSELYEDGFNDTEIAVKLGISEYAVGSWRRLNDLPAIGRNELSKFKKSNAALKAEAKRANEMHISYGYLHAPKVEVHIPKNLKTARERAK